MGNTNWMTGATTPSVTTEADPYGQTRSDLTSWLNSQIGQNGPQYSGQITAPMSAPQQTSLQELQQYQDTPLSSNTTLNNASNFANNELTTDYNPATSPAYAAIKSTSDYNLGNQLNQINSDAAGGGAYWTGARVKQDQNAETQANNNLNSTLAGLQQQNTENQIATLPQAQQIASTQQNYPLQQATAGQTLGALPQELQQNTDNALLNQFYQSQYQYPLQVGSLAAGVQQAPLYGQNTNPLMTGLGEGAGQATDVALMMAMMGCWVAAEVFNGWKTMKPYLARHYIQNLAPASFRKFYMHHGEKIANFIHDKLIFKILLRPIFEIFALCAKRSLAERIA